MYQTRIVYFVVYLAVESSLLAQPGLPRSEDEFKAASKEAKRELVVKIIRHTDDLAPEELAAVLRASLADPDRAFREGALAAISARTIGPLLVRGTSIRQDWNRDRAALQPLRPRVEDLLRKDTEESIRADAVSTFASFDYDPSAPQTGINAVTVRILLERYYADSSPRVKAKIVTGLSVVPGPVTESVGVVLKDAIAFPDRRVRFAALHGMAKLGSDGRILLFSALRDSDRSVRIQAAILVDQRADLRPEDLPAIESGLEREEDAQARAALERAAIRIRTRR